MQMPPREAFLPPLLHQGTVHIFQTRVLEGPPQPVTVYSAVPSPPSSGHSNFHNPQTYKKQTRCFNLLFNSPARVCSHTHAGGGKQMTGGEGRNKPGNLSCCFHLLSSYFSAKHRLRRQHRLLPALPPVTRELHYSKSSDHAVAPALRAGVRMCSIYRPHQGSQRARRVELYSTYPQSPPCSSDLWREGFPTPTSPALPYPRSARPWVRAPGSKWPGGPARPARRQARRGAGQGARTLSTADSGGGGAPASPRAVRAGARRGAAARLVYLLGQGQCALAAAPRLLPRLLGSCRCS